MNKKERVISTIEKKDVDVSPCCFSLHFHKDEAFGDEAVSSHLKFFEETGMDILKIMNENLVPVVDIKSSLDWKKIPSYSLDDSFMKSQIDITDKILKSCKEKDIFSIGTIHGICASAIHPIEAIYGYEGTRQMLCDHLRENKDIVLEAFQRITDIIISLAKKYIELGLDGIYLASLGAETKWFTDTEFQEYIAEFDKQIIKATKDAGGYVFFHICKSGLDMNRYKGFDDIVDVINWGVYENNFSLEDGRKLFPNAAIMGGLSNRDNPLITGTETDIRNEIINIRKNFGEKGLFIGADCTLPTDLSYGKIKTAVEASHSKI